MGKNSLYPLLMSNVSIKAKMEMKEVAQSLENLEVESKRAGERCKVKQGITNTLALPIDKMLYRFKV